MAAVILDVRRHHAYDQHNFGVFETTWVNSNLRDIDIDHNQTPVSWDPDLKRIDTMVHAKLHSFTPARALMFVGKQWLRWVLAELDMLE